MVSGRFPVLAVLAATIVLGGCAGETTITPDTGPIGQPKLSFLGLEGEPPCLSLGEDTSLPVPVLVELQEVVLRPPGGCGERIQCGSLRLLVDDVPNATSSVLSVGFRPDQLADPIHDGSPHEGTGEPDLLGLRVELVTDLDEVLLDPFTGDEVADEVAVRTVVDCTEPPTER